MARILDLRKKLIKVPSKIREEIGIDKKIVRKIRQSELTETQKSPQIFWEAPSFYYNPQKRYLSMLVAALFAGATALFIFKYDSLTSIFLILSSLVLILYSTQRPTASKIMIDQRGIWIDEKIYYYKDLRSFWIEYNPGGSKELSIESRKWYMPYIKVLLNEQNPVEIRSLVINFLPEKEHENSLADHIGRMLGL